MTELPDGVVTFLFTDIEGSTRLWEEAPDLMMSALDQHDHAIDKAVDAHNGVSVKPRGEGDSRFIVFNSAVDAVSAAADLQRGLAAIDWATPHSLRVRASLHTGTAELQMSDYYGSAVNRAARLRAIAHGGQTVISSSTRELVEDHLPDGVTIRDMGEHGLKDLTRPERVYQVDIEGLLNEFPPLASLGAVPNNLPVQLTEFVGRQAEVEEVKRILVETRMLTILAPGGAGKTRLAIQSAAEISDKFPDGVFFVDLAPISSPDDIAQTVAESIGIALSTVDDPLSQLLAYLSHKAQLLVIDNFEHLNEGAGFVSSVLIGALNVRVIVTSRSKLNIEGETVMPLAGLDTTWETEEEAYQTSSVELFVDSAKRTDASFTLSDEDLESVAEILQLVDGMPLAINLAAAWVDMLTVVEIASEISGTLDFLETESGGVPDRHRSMKAVFDYSWRMLGEEERRVFAALSVFRGGFTRGAAEEVAGASMRALANLANKSLLTADRESKRYQVHELLRQYAEAELREDSQLWMATTDAHIAFYCGVAGRVEHEIGIVDQAELLDAVEADIDNIRLAWRTAAKRGDGDSIRRFVYGIFLHHQIRGWNQAALSLLDEALESITEPQDDATAIALAGVTAERGRFLAALGSPGSALDLTGPAVAALAELSAPFTQLMAIEAHLDALAFAGRWDEIYAKASEGFAIANKIEHEWWQAGMLNWVGMSEAFRGHSEEGMSAFADAADRLSRLEDDYLTAWNLIARAAVALMNGQAKEALDLSRQVVKHSRSIRFTQTLQVGLQSVGEASIEVGDFAAANDAFMEALTISEGMGMATSMAFILIKIAEVRSGMGKKELAVEIIACVMADPASAQRMPTQGEKIGEEGARVLGELEAEMTPETYEASYTRGQAKTLEVTAKELLGGD